MRLFKRLAVAVVAIALVASVVAFAKARHQAAPPSAELYGEGVFSTGDYELPPTFTPDGNTAYFTVSTPVYARTRFIVESRRTAGRWSEPVVSSFSGQYDDADPFITRDGKQLFFLSKRPIAPGMPVKRDLDIWVMRREGNGWSAPKHVAKASGQADEHYVTTTTDGTMYIAAVRYDSRNLGDVYRVPLVNGEYGEPENLGPTVNAPELHDTTPFVSPDGNWIIFGSRGRADSFGDLDLYITVKRDGQWTAPKNLGQAVNSSAAELCPLVTPDGYLYFTSLRSFVDRGLQAPIQGKALRPMLRGPGNTLGDTYRVKLAPVLASLGVAVSKL
jgi:Tol biopolymer transport system component